MWRGTLPRPYSLFLNATSDHRSYTPVYDSVTSIHPHVEFLFLLWEVFITWNSKEASALLKDSTAGKNVQKQGLELGS